MISTLHQTQPIQFIIIDGQYTRKLNLSIPDMNYFLIAISAIISLLIFAGRVIEAHQMVMREDTLIIESIILVKILWWITTSLLKL